MTTEQMEPQLAQPEYIEAPDLAYLTSINKDLQIASLQLELMQSRIESVQLRVSAKYKIMPGDSINEKDGQIIRKSVEV